METTPKASTGMALALSRTAPDDIGRIGVKAANQASLLQAGFRVPEGIVLTADAYTKFGARRTRDGSGTPEAETSAAFLVEVRHLLAEIAETLGDTRLAVRSSGVTEDLPDASFAGQYETVLRVKGLDELEEAVRRCWASAASTHATAYRDTHGLGAAPMAVLVQRMVDADAAGVAFSANPVTGRRGEVIINAVRGLGDKLVSGQVSPDEWLVKGGDARCAVSPEGAISAEQAQEIAEMARSVEAHFSAPQDIEWAIAGNQLYVLQARPITALPEPPVEPIPIEFEVPSGFWTHDASHNPRPGHHIDLLVFPLIRRASQRWAANFGYLFDGIEWTEVGLWPYQRIVPLGGREGPAPPKWMMRLLVRALPSLRRRVRRAIHVIRSDAASRYVDRWSQEWQPELDASVRALLRVDLLTLTDTELVSHIESARDLLERGIQTHMVLHGALSVILAELSTTCRQLLGWDLAKTMELVSGTSYKSTEPARALYHLTRMVARRPAIAGLLEHPEQATADTLTSVDPEFAQAFNEYLDQYCHRALGYSLAEPTLAEMPGTVLSLIRGQLRCGYDPEREAEASAETRAAAVAEARTRLAGRDDELSRFERSLTRAVRGYPVREDNEFFTMSAPLAVLRYAVLEVGRRLSERRVITRAPDVMHLELERALSAIFEGGDVRHLVDQRKGERAWAELNPGPPFYGEPPPGPPDFDFLPPDARLPMESILWSNQAIMEVGWSAGSDREEESTLVGISAAPGRYTGPARVVMDETQFEKLRPGDVLVCPITSPVWSILFPVIGGLVTDTGGVLSHPAIIAREYGIPAVVATGQATSTLQDDQIVTVDGSSGEVRIE